MVSSCNALTQANRQKSIELAWGTWRKKFSSEKNAENTKKAEKRVNMKKIGTIKWVICVGLWFWFYYYFFLRRRRSYAAIRMGTLYFVSAYIQCKSIESSICYSENKFLINLSCYTSVGTIFERISIFAEKSDCFPNTRYTDAGSMYLFFQFVAIFIYCKIEKGTRNANQRHFQFYLFRWRLAGYWDLSFVSLYISR